MNPHRQRDVITPSNNSRRPVPSLNDLPIESKNGGMSPPLQNSNYKAQQQYPSDDKQQPSSPRITGTGANPQYAAGNNNDDNDRPIRNNKQDLDEYPPEEPPGESFPMGKHPLQGVANCLELPAPEELSGKSR